MKFHKDIEYALICLTAMAHEQRLFSARELSENQRIPYGILCKILQRLSSTGVVRSIQGPRGGYQLDRDPSRVTLGEIMTTVHGRQHVAPCLDETKVCAQDSDCSIRGGILKVESLWKAIIDDMTLADFMAQKKQRHDVPLPMSGK